MLVAGGGDHRLRVWRRRGQGAASLEHLGTFGSQKGSITALVQNDTYLASASGFSTYNPLLMLECIKVFIVFIHPWEYTCFLSHTH